MLTSLVQRLASVVLVQPQVPVNNYPSNRNKEYYLENIIFQVEGQLFKVNRHLFVRLSPVFQDMFEGSGTDGSSDEQPLILEDIKKKDFIQLLKCLYPLQFQGTFDYEFSLEEWQSVLTLASLYEMTEVKTFAIGRMDPLLIESPSLQIHLSKAYDIGEWLLPGLLGLVRRDKVLNEEDVTLVGLSDALKICALRERKRRCERCGSCGVGVHSGGFELEDVRRVFGICDLPSSVPQFEQICTCPPGPPATMEAAQTMKPPPPPIGTVQGYNPAMDKPRPCEIEDYLRNYDVLFVVDDSSSMAGTPWNEARDAPHDIAQYAFELDVSSVNLRFLNNRSYDRGLQGAQALRSRFDNVSPDGATPTGAVLDKVLTDHLDKIDRAMSNPAEYSKILPLDIIVLTDGQPTDNPADTIAKAVKRLKNSKYHPNTMGVQFVQIGNAQDARVAS